MTGAGESEHRYHAVMSSSSSARGGFPGAVRLFRLAGIDVFLHWTWLLIAVILVQRPISQYQAPIWGVVEYLSLFAIVLMHEFGHSLACRSVGGRAERILLWPFGGVAYVIPPRRPGAILWSIVAGPLVNVFLLPISVAALYTLPGWLIVPGGDAEQWLHSIVFMNIVLLVFNLMPIYPLDGGQILQALLWFFVGEYRSLAIASSLGLVGAAAIIGAALYFGNVWLILLAFMGASRSMQGLRYSKALKALATSPRHGTFACPSCRQHPPAGAFWRCDCGGLFDTFDQRGWCPHCGVLHARTTCPMCGAMHPMGAWVVAAGIAISDTGGD